MLISSRDLADRAGVTYRQVDYWCTKGVITPALLSRGGSGGVRRWNEDDIGRVRLLGKISSMTAGNLHSDVLKKVHDAYEDGHVELVEGVVLSWMVE